MQATTTTQVVCPKPTDAQISAQIENMRWQEKQQEINNAAQLRNQTVEQGMRQQQLSTAHTEYMVGHLAIPSAGTAVAIVAAFVIVHLNRMWTAADIQKNKDDNDAETKQNEDDNQSNVRYAQYIIDKHEGASE